MSAAYIVIEEFDGLHDRLIDCEEFLESKAGTPYVRELERELIKLTRMVAEIEEAAEKASDSEEEEAD